jgi:small subunit ribosomal protein S6
VSHLRLYDVLIIIDPRLTEEEVAQFTGRLQESFAALGGEVASIENWGKRRLSFEIRKQREGTYVLLQVKAEPAVVREFERQLRLNESALRYMTTRVEEKRRRATPGASDEAGPAAAEPALDEAVGPTAGDIG